MIERMTYRKHKKKWMIYPEDKFKSFWDLMMTVILLTACITTPLEIAFSSDSDVSIENPWSLVIDVMFLLDMILIFNTAYYDQDQEIITCRKMIACSYLKSWFVLDTLAVIPFDVLINASQFNGLARVVRVGRLYKLVKLSKLLRMMKILKNRNKILKQLSELLKIGLGCERLFFFILLFFLALHLAACFWLICASILTSDSGNKENFEGTWLYAYKSENENLSVSDMYVLAIYWAV